MRKRLYNMFAPFIDHMLWLNLSVVFFFFLFFFNISETNILVSAASPVVLELTPLLGMLTGVVASLILLALGIVLVLRLRGKDCEEKQHHKINNSDIKMSNESMDSLEKNPDIIPHNNGKYVYYKLGLKMYIILISFIF